MIVVMIMIVEVEVPQSVLVTVLDSGSVIVATTSISISHSYDTQILTPAICSYCYCSLPPILSLLICNYMLSSSVQQRYSQLVVARSSNVIVLLLSSSYCHCYDTGQLVEVLLIVDILLAMIICLYDVLRFYCSTIQLSS